MNKSILNALKIVGIYGVKSVTYPVMAISGVVTSIIVLPAFMSMLVGLAIPLVSKDRAPMISVLGSKFFIGMSYFMMIPAWITFKPFVLCEYILKKCNIKNPYPDFEKYILDATKDTKVGDKVDEVDTETPER